MQLTETSWTETEKTVAEQAFTTAYARETNALIKTVCEQSTEIQQLEDIWRLHDFLSARRHDLDGKYDYRYSSLIFVFAQLLKQGWLTLEDLQGLTPEKLKKISALARM
ncbi:hypothetical protein [Gloeocapsa sp. PCC 73106]|uniref:hypothetical protein n=1 Tax=Gloeocapsa sp. PCC 73106 TaxID=102232 RepID=UPI0002E11815|nr:hypothetical protein [Gloeocapsa sp. PCC 73106]